MKIRLTLNNKILNTNNIKPDAIKIPVHILKADLKSIKPSGLFFVLQQVKIQERLQLIITCKVDIIVYKKLDSIHVLNNIQKAT